jgi:hypothetical protein
MYSQRYWPIFGVCRRLLEAWYGLIVGYGRHAHTLRPQLFSTLELKLFMQWTHQTQADSEVVSFNDLS